MVDVLICPDSLSLLWLPSLSWVVSGCPQVLICVNTRHLWEDCRVFRRWQLARASGSLGVAFEGTPGVLFSLGFLSAGTV